MSCWQLTYTADIICSTVEFHTRKASLKSLALLHNFYCPGWISNCNTSILKRIIFLVLHCSSAVIVVLTVNLVISNF